MKKDKHTIGPFQGKWRFLSNFYPSIVELDGMEYPTVEHAFQAAKTTESAVRRDIAVAPKPRDAKRLGRELDLRPDWEKVKLQIMEDLVRQKFQNPELRSLLLDTGNRPIAEINHWNDKFWGVCNGIGKNWLGKILMKIRTELQHD